MEDAFPTLGWSTAIEGRSPPRTPPGEPIRIGVLEGEGIGPDVVGAAIASLRAVADVRSLELSLTELPPRDGERPVSSGLSEEVARFCESTFAAGGALLAGAHGGRWVYELRRRFDLFCKISPLRPHLRIGETNGGADGNRLDDVDLLVVREQSAGVYQGRWSESVSRRDGRVAEHSFSYSEREVRRLIGVAAELARRRRGRLTVVVKDAGIPSISRLWRDCAADAATEGLTTEVLDIDYAVYRMLRDPDQLDVIAAPNLFGDLLSDAGGALMGSRGITFGGNFDAGAAAVYQTNHGAAHDLAGSDRANPAGQILSAAMLLKESFGLEQEAGMIEGAVAATWRQGWRTDDVAEAGSRVIGTAEMGKRVAGAVSASSGDSRAGPL